ncbi:MAG: 7-cyano-7-deazaguanine reductase [Alcanivorax sp.]|jgi:7-cyano-7-deazaguanine reductase
MTEGEGAKMLLGRQVAGPAEYAPEVLFPIARQQAREELGITSPTLPFYGEDIWHAYELSWLLPDGRPTIFLGRLHIPATSPNLVESKSLKLYLNSLNTTVFDSEQAALATIEPDLSKAIGCPVTFSLFRPDDPSFAGVNLSGHCIDSQFLPVSKASGRSCLTAAGSDVSEVLYSHLLRSLCPVTGQPDWASVWLRYRGPKIDQGSLLAYLLGFREHQEFHEQCVERMFIDIDAACSPGYLEVQALYTRRGGLDICPWRSSEPGIAPVHRMNRQ